MIQIPLSLIGSADKFAAALEAHRGALEAHRLGDVHQAAPIAPHDLLDQLVLRVTDTGPIETRKPDRFVVVPYEVLDDTPPPPSIEDKKRDLLTSLYAAAALSRDSVMSPARVRLLQLDCTKALATEEEKRSRAQWAALELRNEFASRCVDIEHIVSRAVVEIVECTAADIDSWKIPSFD